MLLVPNCCHTPGAKTERCWWPKSRDIDTVALFCSQKCCQWVMWLFSVALFDTLHWGPWFLLNSWANSLTDHWDHKTWVNSTCDSISLRSTECNVVASSGTVASLIGWPRVVCLDNFVFMAPCVRMAPSTPGSRRESPQKWKEWSTTSIILQILTPPPAPSCWRIIWAASKKACCKYQRWKVERAVICNLQRWGCNHMSCLLQSSAKGLALL